jgi:hypothetical protein
MLTAIGGWQTEHISIFFSFKTVYSFENFQLNSYCIYVKFVGSHPARSGFTYRARGRTNRDEQVAVADADVRGAKTTGHMACLSTAYEPGMGWAPWRTSQPTHVRSS